MKRFLSFILSLIMLLSLVPSAAFAEAGDVPAQEQTQALPAEPEVTAKPETTAAPETTAVPETTTAPEVTAAPETTAAPEPTESPAPSEEPAVLTAENNGIAVYAATPVHITLDYNYDGLTEERVCAVGSNYNYVYNADTGNSKYSALPDPTRTGYIFLGWYDAAEGGSEVS